MPSVSKKQARFMAAIAHSPAFSAKAGVSQKVGKDFNQADAGTGVLKTKHGYRHESGQFHHDPMKEGYTKP